MSIFDYDIYIDEKEEGTLIEENFKRAWAMHKPMLDKAEAIWFVVTTIIPIFMLIRGTTLFCYFFSFIAIDIIGFLLNMLLFKWLPIWNEKERELEEQIAYCNKLKNALDTRTKKLEASKSFKRCLRCCYLLRFDGNKKYNCSNRYSRADCSCISSTIQNIYVLSEILEKEREKIKNIQIENLESKTNSKDDEDYRISNILIILRALDKTNIKRIKTLIKNLEDIEEITNKYPEKKRYVQEKTYIYLEELGKILSKYSEMSEESKNNYSEKLQGIVDELIRIISELFERLEKMDTEDFDVTVDVLYRELINLNKRQE